MVKKILLNSRKYPGHYALVDDEDYEWLNQWNWTAHKKATKSRILFYAVRSSGQGLGQIKRHDSMHRLIMDGKKGQITDHINGNGLDNRRCNLRVVTFRQNQQNRHVKTTSKYPGVSLEHNRWKATMHLDGKTHYLGHFGTEIEAFNAYRKAVHELTGEKLICEVKEAMEV